MTLRKCTLLCMAATGLTGGLAKADWNPGDPYKMHYPQLPDMTPSGLDVNATFWQTTTTPIYPYQKILADDFKCTQSGPINDVHLWGSWLYDEVYPNAQFKLSIHADIPAVAGVSGSYSRPGAELWSRMFAPASYVRHLYGSGPERFYDPNTNQFLGTDNQIWQYNFTNIPEPFVQTQGQIYWLDVQVLTPQPFVFGWKTTNPLQTPHFMDDAVYGDTISVGPAPYPQFPDPNPAGSGLLPWKDMHYPDGQFLGQSMDLAFVITPEPVSLSGIALCGLLLMRRK